MSDLIKSSFGCDPGNTVCSAETEDIVKSKESNYGENILEQMDFVEKQMFKLTVDHAFKVGAT